MKVQNMQHVIWVVTKALNFLPDPGVEEDTKDNKVTATILLVVMEIKTLLANTALWMGITAFAESHSDNVLSR